MSKELNYRKIKKNLQSVLDSASDVEYATGCTWYALHKALITRIAGRNSITNDVAAGAFSAMSPGLTIEANLTEFESMVQLYSMGFSVEDFKPHRVPYSFKSTFGKAWGILQGTLSLEGAFAPDTKTQAFYYNLSGDLSRVTIDGHIMNACVNGMTRVGISSKNINITPNRYRQISKLITDMGEAESLRPAQVQAIIWIVYRDLSFKRRRGEEDE